MVIYEVCFLHMHVLQIRQNEKTAVPHDIRELKGNKFYSIVHANINIYGYNFM